MSLIALFIESNLRDASTSTGMGDQSQVGKSEFKPLPGAHIVTGEITADTYDHTELLRVAYNEQMFGHPDA